METHARVSVKGFLMLGIIIALICGCSDQVEKEKNYENNAIEQSGLIWDAKVKPNIIKRSGKKYFQIEYTFKGTSNELNTIDRISFAQGTSLGTQIINVFDPSYVETLSEHNDHDSIYDFPPGIVMEEIKNRPTKSFIIDYDWIETLNDPYTVWDAIREDRILITINWEKNGETYSETLPQ